MTLKITPPINCPECHGSGEVYDWVPVPFGVGNCRMTSLCSCVEDQIPEGTPDDVEIEIVYSESWTE